jgi:hypothetical protein
MASKIVPTNIDGTFPVAGQDNSSQGFRDNFTNIKNNFTFARNEIGDLQSKAVLTAALDGTALSNDMAGTQLVRPQLKAWTQSVVDRGSVSGTVNVSFFQGNFQKITAAGPIILGLTDWPSVGAGGAGYGALRLWIVITDPITQTLTLPASVTIGAADIAGYVDASRTIVFDTPGNYVFDFSSIDNGTNFLIFDNTRNRVQFRDPSFYFNEIVSPTFLIGFQDALQLALRLSTGNDTLQIRGSQTNYAGVLEHGNDAGIGIEAISTPTLGGNANVAGYSVGTSRAYINANTGQPVIDSTAFVQSNDYIGYVNFLGATVNPANIAEAAICDFGTIRGFVQGSSSLSPGGNLVVYTKSDLVQPYTGNLRAALSIENDQATHFYGAAITRGAEVSAGYQFANISADNTVSIVANTSVVLLDSTLGANVAAANILLPPVLASRDGQRMTIASNCNVASVSFITSQTTTFVSNTVVSGFNILTMSADNDLQPGMLVTSGASFTSGQFITSILDNGLVTANVVISAAPNSPLTPGATLTFSTGATVSGAPASYTANSSAEWIYRSANQRWYKIG